MHHLKQYLDSAHEFSNLCNIALDPLFWQWAQTDLFSYVGWSCWQSEHQGERFCGDLFFFLNLIKGHPVSPPEPELGLGPHSGSVGKNHWMGRPWLLPPRPGQDSQRTDATAAPCQSDGRSVTCPQGSQLQSGSLLSGCWVEFYLKQHSQVSRWGQPCSPSKSPFKHGQIYSSPLVQASVFLV